MKRLITFFSALAVVVSVSAQTIVPTEPENKNVVLEEFTGIHCGYCPYGHQTAQQILSSHPDDVSVIAIHTGGYANPSAGEPDYRTDWGAAIAGQSGLTGYPSGTVNRHLFPNLSPSATALGRGSWANASNQIMAQPSYLNIEANATIVTSSRQLSVLVEVYYTGDSPVDVNYLNVALTQNNIVGPQSGGGSNYVHQHMLRDLLTGQWGIPIQTTTEGSFYTTTLMYSIPEHIRDVEVVLEDLHLVAFVAESHQEIVSGNGAHIETISGVDVDAAAMSISKLPQTYCGGELSPAVVLKNFGSNPLTSVTIEYAFNQEASLTYEWTGNLATNESEVVDLPAFTPEQALQNNAVSVNLVSPNGVEDELPGNNMSMQSMESCIEATQNCKMAFYIPQGADEVSWELVSATGEVVISGGPYDNNGVYQHPFAFPADGMYTFKLHDDGGDAFGGSGFVKLFSVSKGVIWEADMDEWTSDLVAQFGYNYDAVETIEVVEDVMNVYPNPTSGVAYVDYYVSKAAANVKVEVYDVLGKMYHQAVVGVENAGLQQYTINVEAWQSGLYIVNIIVDGERITKKLNVVR